MCFCLHYVYIHWLKINLLSFCEYYLIKGRGFDLDMIKYSVILLAEYDEPKHYIERIGPETWNPILGPGNFTFITEPDSDILCGLLVFPVVE